MKINELLIEAYIHPGIKKILRAKGYKYLGKGVDQIAFLAPDGWVLKIFGTSERATRGPIGTLSRPQQIFKAFADYCMAHPDNPFLPNFDGWETFEFDGRTYLQIRVERMFPFKKGSGQDWNHFLKVIADYASKDYESISKTNKEKEGYIEFLMQVSPKNGSAFLSYLGKEGFNTLWDTIYDLANLGRKIGIDRLDLHPGNFMLGSDGHIVINDPFHVSEPAIQRTGLVLAEGKLITDVPSNNWLKGKVDYSIRKGRNRYGAPYFNATTAYIKGSDVRLPVDLLKTLPGMSGEQKNVRHDDLNAIMKIMKGTGKLPMTSYGEEYVPFIMVAYNGEAWVNEGNHRIMAAAKLGWDSLPVELKYFDGGERVKDGPLYPGKIGLGEPDDQIKESINNKITLNDLYKGNLPDRDEIFWDHVGTKELSVPLEIKTLDAHRLLIQLLSQYRVEHIDELVDMLDDDQRDILDHYLKDPNLNNKIIVIADDKIIDGNHRALAAAIKKQPIRYVDLSDLNDIVDEMALAKYQTMGNFDKPGPFRGADKRLIPHPKNELKTQKFFEKTPYDFRLFFSNVPGFGRYSEHGPMEPNEIRNTFNKEQADQIIDGHEDAITVVFVGNKGDAKVMLTPWIMAHRFGHAIQAGVRRNQRWSPWAEAEKHFFTTINGFLKEYYNKVQPTGEYSGGNVKWSLTPEYNALFNAIGTQRSSRTGKIKRPYEFLYELLAQYIGTGKITLNPLPTKLGYGRTITFMIIKSEYRNQSDLQHASEMLARDMELMFDDVLSSSVGNIYVM